MIESKSKTFSEPLRFLFGVLLGGLFVSVLLLAILSRGDVIGDGMARHSVPTASAITDSNISSITNLPHVLKVADSRNNFAIISSFYDSLVEKSETDVLPLLKQLESVPPGSLSRSMQSAVLERLLEINPDSALHHALNTPTLQRFELVENVFREWALSDLRGAIAAGINLEQSLRRVAVEAILQTRVDLSESKLREIGRKFGGEDWVLRKLFKERVWTHSGNPEKAWNEITSNEPNLARRIDLLADVVEDWWSRENVGMVSKIIESIDPGSDLWTSENFIVLRVAMQILARHDPSQVFDQAKMSNEPVKEALLDAIAQEWARSDPKSALKAMAEYEQYESRKVLTKVVATGWAQSNPHELLESLDSYSRDVQLLAAEAAILKIGRSNWHEAINLTEEIARADFDTSTITLSIYRAWSAADPQATLEFIMSDTGVDNLARKDILKDILLNLVHVNPELTMDSIILNPSDESLRSLEALAVGTLAYSDIDAALRLLPRVRAESKLMTFSLVGNVLVHNNEAQRALKLADHLAKQDKPTFYSSVIHHWARFDPRQLFESLNDLPSDAVRSKAAEVLTLTHANNPVLTMEELDYAASLLNKK